VAGAAYAIAGGLTDVLKRAFDRPRPSLVDPAVHPLVAVPHSAAMPSGHASTAFAAAVAVGLVHPRLRWPLLALAALIALSRVWLGVHYLTDVIAGAALGAAIAFVLWRVSIRVFPEARPGRHRR
jgi:membrane-associated phospholipid phosphatase